MNVNSKFIKVTKDRISEVETCKKCERKDSKSIDVKSHKTMLIPTVFLRHISLGILSLIPKHKDQDNFSSYA